MLPKRIHVRLTQTIDVSGLSETQCVHAMASVLELVAGVAAVQGVATLVMPAAASMAAYISMLRVIS